MVLQSPVWLLGLPPVMESEHDGEGVCRQHLLVVVVVETVSCCQGKSVANLRRQKKIKMTELGNVGDVLTNTALHLLLMYSDRMSSSRRSAAIQG